MSIVVTRHKAVLFDLDGVITNTAQYHCKSYEETFNEYLKKLSVKEGTTFVPFTYEEYLDLLDGRPRYPAVDAFLRSRGVVLPFGTQDEPPSELTVCGIGNKKGEFYLEMVKTNGPKVFKGTVTLAKELLAHGIRTGVVSSSKSCETQLRLGGIDHLFEIRIDGTNSQTMKLRGKPNSDCFIEGAKMLGVSPENAVVIEDSVSGIKSGVSGNFDLLIGVDRRNSRDKLLEAGADVVVEDLSEVQVLPPPTIPCALTKLDEIHNRAKESRLVFFFDYDGTLTPIVARPEFAILSLEMRHLLTKLGQKYTVAVVSGRDLDQLQEMIGLEGIYYAGCHGYEFRNPDGVIQKYEKADAFVSLFNEVAVAMGEAVKDIPNAWVEHKKYSVATHYRQVDDALVPQVEAAVVAVQRKFPTCRKMAGKMIFEFVPDMEWHKGKAVDFILELLGLNHSGVLPFYLGDDVTDENAFREFRNKGYGIGIAVHDYDRPTSADYYVETPEHLGEFLKKFL